MPVPHVALIRSAIHPLPPHQPTPQQENQGVPHYTHTGQTSSHPPSQTPLLGAVIKIIHDVLILRNPAAVGCSFDTGSPHECM